MALNGMHTSATAQQSCLIQSHKIFAVKQMPSETYPRRVCLPAPNCDPNPAITLMIHIITKIWRFLLWLIYATFLLNCVKIGREVFM